MSHFLHSMHAAKVDLSVEHIDVQQNEHCIKW